MCQMSASIESEGVCLHRDPRIGYTPKVYPQPHPPSKTPTVSLTGLVLSRLFKTAKAAQKLQGLSWARITNGD